MENAIVLVFYTSFHITRILRNFTLSNFLQMRYNDVAIVIPSYDVI